MEDCVFCKVVRGETPSTKIYENDNFFSILNINPIAEGHGLVLSKKHFETMLDLPSSLGEELLDCIKKTAVKLIEKYNAEGFNVFNNNKEVAGQIIKHIHFHIIPRKKGDGLKLLT